MRDQPVLTCQNERRRFRVREHEDLNGLDYVEVVSPYTLRVYFLGKAPTGLAKENVRITGGQRIQDIEVIGFRLCTREEAYIDDCMIITVDKTGDFSPYTLCVVALDERGRPTGQPFPGFDPRYACVDFSFKIDCPSDLDCKQPRVCPPPEYDEPEINYLAKDYASFRQLILDRLALIMPGWQERHVPDLGIALVELLAYVGDHLSYYQDAVATEAYLDTARQRISVRRHARLVDYQMHEGCNARAWVHVETESDEKLDPTKLSFIAGGSQVFPVPGRVLTWEDLDGIPISRYEVFEPLLHDPEKPLVLYESHNEIFFWTWGDRECCLPEGATKATLKDGTATKVEPEDVKPGVEQTSTQQAPTATKLGTTWEYHRQLHLQVGDILIFEEVIGPRTGKQADADPSRRHAVRLTRVEEAVDELYPQPVLKIEWAEADALPFPFCISTIGPPDKCEMIENVSVARGNVLLVDHGRRVEGEPLDCVPLAETEVECEAEGQASTPHRIPGLFRPHLRGKPLTFYQPPAGQLPASRLLDQDPRQAVPWARLFSAPDPECAAVPSPAGQMANDGDPAPTTEWTAVRDLLASGADDPHFVVEIDNEGRAHLRFGDGESGKQPEAETKFTATYRVGNGPAGNVGAGTISRAVYWDLLSGVVLKPCNPLPAVGGFDPEPMAEVKLFAPHAFRTELQRAVTGEDYAAIVMRDFPDRVQRAAATLRWNGSWYEVLVVVDPRSQAEVDPALFSEIAGHLRRFRRIGHDLVVRAAEYVPLDVALTVCVLPHYLRGHVKAALLSLFSNRRLPDGTLGFFHPDNLSFGGAIRLSQLVAAAMTVPGVENVVVTRLERLHAGPNGELEAGLLPLGSLEVARLDNDPSFPDRGRFNLDMRGGR